MKKCVLEEKTCIDCGSSDTRCELDPSKECDNCFRCLEQDAREYAEIPIDSIILDGDDADEDPFEAHDPDSERYVGERVWHVQTIPGWHAKRLR